MNYLDPIVGWPMFMRPRDLTPQTRRTAAGWPSVYVQEKLNGVRALLSPYGLLAMSKSYRTWPLLEDRFSHTLNLWLDGEIMWPGHSLQELTGLLNSAATETTSDQAESLQFHVFDAAPFKGTLLDDLTAPFRRRLQTLNALANDLVGTDIILSATERIPGIPLTTDWSMYPPEVEGFIYRNGAGVYAAGHTPDVLKLKRMYEQEYTVLKVHEGNGKFAGMFGAATLDLGHGNGKTLNCGGGLLTVADRKMLWALRARLLGQRVTVRFPYRSDDGTPLQAQWVSWRNYE